MSTWNSRSIGGCSSWAAPSASASVAFGSDHSGARTARLARNRPARCRRWRRRSGRTATTATAVPPARFVAGPSVPLRQVNADTRPTVIGRDGAAVPRRANRHPRHGLRESRAMASPKRSSIRRQLVAVVALVLSRPSPWAAGSPDRGCSRPTPRRPEPPRRILPDHRAGRAPCAVVPRRDPRRRRARPIGDRRRAGSERRRRSPASGSRSATNCSRATPSSRCQDDRWS